MPIDEANNKNNICLKQKSCTVGNMQDLANKYLDNLRGKL